MSPIPSPISASVEYETDGASHGQLHLPYSRDDSAYGAVMIPISVIRNGLGPTVLLTGGNHGDEYHGPLSLTKLTKSLDPGRVRGRVIIVPQMNQPAFAAASRTSPIDDGNLNRSFPGRPDGSVTEKIADYLARYLLPISDFVLDIHDGGKTLEFIPMASSLVLDDPELQAAGAEAAAAFGAPYTTQLVEIDTIGMWDALVGTSGKPFVTTELSGGGTTRPETMAITDRGVHNLLVHWGVLDAEPIASETTQIEIPEVGGYVLSESDGLIEWLVGLGRTIAADQPIALVHDTRRPSAPAVEYRATIDGILAMRHYPGLVKYGDAIAMQARPMDNSFE